MEDIIATASDIKIDELTQAKQGWGHWFKVSRILAVAALSAANSIYKLRKDINDGTVTSLNEVVMRLNGKKVAAIYAALDESGLRDWAKEELARSYEQGNKDDEPKGPAFVPPFIG